MSERLMTICFSLLLWAGTVWASEPSTSDRNLSAPAKPEDLLRRVVLIGASATSGFKTFGSTNPADGAFFSLRPYLEAALLLPHEPVASFASSFFFLAPTPTSKAQVERTIAAGPSLAIAADFLFWHCYGDSPSEEHRLERLEKGLEILAPLKSPLLVGTIPDVSGAANGILRPAQIPKPETLARANHRIKEWAGARDQTAVLDLAAFMANAASNEPIRFRGHSIVETQALLQEDKLHPSPRGAAVLALTILDTLLPEDGKAAVRWNLEEVIGAAEEKVQAALAKRAARRSAEKRE